MRDQKYTPGQVAQIKALLAKKFDPEDRSPEAKGHRFLKRLLEYGQASQHSRYATQLALPFAIMTRQETAEHNRKLIQQAVMGHDIPERQITLDAVLMSRCFPF